MRKLRQLFFLLSFLILLPLQVMADDYYDQHAVGWHWYQDPPQERQEKQAQGNQPLFANTNVADPVAQMTIVQQTIKQALDQAILNPTPDNVKNYIAVQNQLSHQASRFANSWQYALLQNPTLDYSLSHPTNQLGAQLYQDQYFAQENAAIRNLASHSGLFFFYRSTCPYCQRFAPIVKAFSEQYGITVVPITTDGIALPDFPDSRVDQGQAETFNVSEEPALFTVDPYTHKAIPVAYGLLSEDELRQRIFEIATNFQGDD